MGGDDQARCNLRTAGSGLQLIPFVPDCEVRESDDEKVDRRAVNPVQKSGLRARTIYLGNGARGSHHGLAATAALRGS